MLYKKFISFFVILLSLIQVYALSATDAVLRNGSIFPAFYYTETLNSLRRAEISLPYWVNTIDEHNKFVQSTANNVSLLLNNDIIVYYGHPNSRNMGILGRHSIEELDRMLAATASKYEEISDGRGIVRAFHLIYGTVWPGAEIGILRHDTLMRYIQYGMENDILIFIDHQMGRYDPIESVRRMLPYLQYPNVHLALDPEWRTLRPMVEIGHLTAEEINRAQQMIEDYLIENELPGERMFMVHQFHPTMIRDRDAVRADFSRVRLVHNIAGIGPPGLKRETYAFGARATNMPVKGFKLWYDLGIPGAGFDSPLMTPQDVYNLNPRPHIIMYQ